MLGLNGGSRFKKWVLLAEYFDFSMLHNYISFKLGNLLPNISYSSDCTFVHVYVDASYRGVYLLAEQNQINKNRINIHKYDPSEGLKVDTGYLFEIDHQYFKTGQPGVDYFDVPIGGTVGDWDHYTIIGDTRLPEQLDFIQTYMLRVFDAIMNNDRDTITALIDLDSAVEMTIHGLISHNPDKGSYYFFKDAGGTLTFGAPWDYDLGFGSWKDREAVDRIFLNRALHFLYQIPWYRQLVINRWQQLRQMGIFDELLSMTRLDDAACPASQFPNAFEYNFEKWNKWGNKTIRFQTDNVLKYRSHADAVNDLHDWLTRKIAWLDIELANSSP